MAPMLHDLLAAASVAGRTGVGLVFVLAATQKAIHWRILPGVISNYSLLQRWMHRPVAVLLVPVEMALGDPAAVGAVQSLAFAGGDGVASVVCCGHGNQRPGAGVVISIAAAAKFFCVRP